MTFKKWFLFATMITLTGCSTMAPKYSQPTAPVPTEWPNGPAYKEAAARPDDMPAADIAWRDFFVAEKLQKVIELALANNRDLRVAALNIEKMRAVYQIQRAELFPPVDASGRGSKQRVPSSISETGQTMTVEQYSVNLGISSWEIGLFRTYPKPERSCAGAVPRHRTGPPQHADRPGRRGCQHLPDPGC